MSETRIEFQGSSFIVCGCNALQVPHVHAHDGIYQVDPSKATTTNAPGNAPGTKRTVIR